MKFIQKIFYILIRLFFLLILLYFISNKEYFYSSFKNTIILWFNYCLPPISISYIISVFLSDFPFISKLLYPLLKPVFNFENEKSCSIYLISILVGNPTSSKLIIQAVDNKQISIDEGNRLLCFSSFISTIFLYSILNFNLFIIIFIIELLISIIISNVKTKNTKQYIIIENKNNTILDTYFNIINNLPSLLLSILFSMIITNLFSSLITNTYLKSLFELTIGIKILTYNINIINLIFIFILIFSHGLAITLQIYWIIKKSNLSFNNFIKYRLLSIFLSLISLIIIYLFVFFL